MGARIAVYVTPNGSANELIKKYTKANGKYLFIFIKVHQTAPLPIC